MVTITADVCTEIIAHAVAALPLEACGMVSARRGVGLVDAFHPMRNAARSSEVFELDGQEWLDLERAAEDAGRELVGVMHSHTASSPFPSPTDVGDSGRYDPQGTYLQLIVSLRDAEPALRCFRIADGAIQELPLVVGDGDDDAEGAGEGTAAAAVIRLPRGT